MLPEDLWQLEKWVDTWGMRFNASKCYTFSLQHSSSFFYQLNSTILQQVRQCPPDCQNTAYLALIQPLLEYGTAVWDPYLKKDISLMEYTQCNAAHFIMGDYRSTTPSSITRLHSSRKQSYKSYPRQSTANYST